MHEMSLAGFTGCCGSSDATHVLLDKCSHVISQIHKGGKSKSTCRSFNITVNHRRRILYSTKGYPARWNDKTVVLFDDYVRGIYKGDKLSDVTFILFERNPDGTYKEVYYKGAWILVDNGYLAWPTTVPPFKHSLSRKEIRWSEWGESMRKDVECTFGILKGRWRILKAGIRLHSVEAADKVWFTCCALHNWLLEIDGLDSKWEGGVASPWQGELGQYADEDIPASIVRLLNPSVLRDYDTSRQGDVEFEINDEDSIAPRPFAGELGDGTSSNPFVVRSMSLDYFRSRLVEHFDCLYTQDRIVWPKSKPKN